MASIFAECRRTLKPDGVMTLMFTHKASGAWDALTKGLMEAGFAITASWPINTEAEGSLHIKNKAAANSTIFLVCRPLTDDRESTDQDLYWEDVEPRVAQAVRERVEEFQAAGIAGVDLYLASFGPALEEFSRHWPLKRGTPREIPEERRRRRQQILFDEEWDPYAATPEDALDAAGARGQTVASGAIDASEGPMPISIPPRRFSSSLGTLSMRQCSPTTRHSGSPVPLVSILITTSPRGSLKRRAAISCSGTVPHRAAKGALGPVDGSRGMIDAIHHAANMARVRSLAAAQEMLAATLVDQDPRFFAALEAVLEVLPVSKAFTGIELEGAAAASGSDFEILYNLTRLAYGDEIDTPEQLKFWQEENA